MKRLRSIAPLEGQPSRLSPYQSHTSPSTPRCLHSSALRSATPLPMTATGPPPAPPDSPTSQHNELLSRRRRQAELLKSAQDIRNSKTAPIPNSSTGSAMKQRFWKTVSVEVPSSNNQNAHIIHLDTRPVRNPLTNPAQPLTIPASKPHLATAVALEWDLLTTASQALRAHLIPLTSLAARAQVLETEDAGRSAAGQLHDGGEGQGIRYEIINTLLRYLDTDTLLCWAPEQSTSKVTDAGRGLRERQMETAKPILSYLTQYVWPGVDLVPTLADGSILPKSQPAATRAVVKGWMAGLPAWELVGLERAVLAGKSLCVAARLVGEWSEELGVGSGSEDEGKRFGVEEAARACSLEVAWQTGQWGEVEDSHDVEKEDLRRQLGGVILLVSGNKKHQ